MILFRSLHNVDVTSGTIISKAIPDDFRSFMSEYVRFATENDTTKRFAIHDMQTQVVNCINCIVTTILANPEITPEIMAKLQVWSDSIADKLLREEQLAQSKIEQMRKFIKKGSLVQALIKTDEQNEYLFIIAKVEHSEWFDGDSLEKNFGFPSDKKSVWKSAVFPITAEDPLVFNAVRVYLDNEAKYWSTNFLELDEEKSDQYNTRIAFEAIQGELKRCIKTTSERDYYILRNTLIQTMKTPQQINYPDLVNKLVGSYVPEDPTLNLDQIRSKLFDLPEKKNFDRQFTTIPDRIIERRYNFFPLTPGVELSIKGAVEDFKNTITAETNDLGSRYIRVLCNDPKTFAIFSPRRDEV